MLLLNCNAKEQDVGTALMIEAAAVNVPGLPLKKKLKAAGTKKQLQGGPVGSTFRRIPLPIPIP